jgi:hypothetical protein
MGKKFRLIFWIDGPFECSQKKVELDAPNIILARKDADIKIQDLSRKFPLHDFGVLKLVQVKETGEEVEIPTAL